MFGFSYVLIYTFYRKIPGTLSFLSWGNDLSYPQSILILFQLPVSSSFSLSGVFFQTFMEIGSSLLWSQHQNLHIYYFPLDLVSEDKISLNDRIKMTKSETCCGSCVWNTIRRLDSNDRAAGMKEGATGAKCESFSQASGYQRTKKCDKNSLGSVKNFCEQWKRE